MKFLSLLFFSIVLVGCINEANSSEVISEVQRLQVISLERNITQSDVSNLSTLVKGNTELEHEFEELEWMLERGYQHHAVHSLQTIYEFSTGEVSLCPANLFSHASPYLKHGEVSKAEHVVEEGLEQLPVWEEKTRRIKAKNPNAYPGLEELISAMNNLVIQMNSKDYASAETTAEFIEEKGYC